MFGLVGKIALNMTKLWRKGYLEYKCKIFESYEVIQFLQTPLPHVRTCTVLLDTSLSPCTRVRKGKIQLDKNVRSFFF